MEAVICLARLLMNLIHYLQQIPDFRTQPRYPLWVVLLLVIMGVMSGCQGYRALEPTFRPLNCHIGNLAA